MDEVQKEAQKDPMGECAAQLSSAAQALERVIGKLEAQYEALNQKIDRIIATVEKLAEEESKEAKVEAGAQMEEARREANCPTSSARRQISATRKTLPALVSTLLAKSGIGEGVQIEAGALDKALGMLSIEQRIAVKAELARAGMIA